MTTSEPRNSLSRSELAAATRNAALDFTESELAQMEDLAARHRERYATMRSVSLDLTVPPSAHFDPRLPGIGVAPPDPPATSFPTRKSRRPARLEDLHFADIPTLSGLIRDRAVSCREVTELFLSRLKAIDSELACVSQLLPRRAMARADELDNELAQGNWRGPLHGIPWGAKDLFCARGTRTTYGAAPFRNQQIDADATVVERLDAEGAVLIAKLTLGALAMGDVWFGGQTKSPWRREIGSSGSSAGSAAAVAAGGVPFALGTETRGSLMSPAAVCGATALRPTFGRVSRHGAMPLAWTMDKVGPMCRTVEDAAWVFAAIQGPDNRDISVVDRPFSPAGALDWNGIRVGVCKADRDSRPDYDRLLTELTECGASLVPFALPEFPLDAMDIALDVEAASVFDDLTRGNIDDELVSQSDESWPNLFRAARLIPAVEYMRSCRLRTLLCHAMAEQMRTVEVIVHPTLDATGDPIALTNLTGHPAVAVPSGVREDGTPWSTTFGGQLFGDARLLGLAQAWQERTCHHRRHPEWAL